MSFTKSLARRVATVAALLGISGLLSLGLASPASAALLVEDRVSQPVTKIFEPLLRPVAKILCGQPEPVEEGDGEIIVDKPEPVEPVEEGA